jgi:hypothetical protein
MAHPTEAQVGDGPKERSPFPPSASISVYQRFKSAIALTSKRAIALSRIRVHQRVSAVQKCDRPVRQKESSPFPPSASIRVYLRFKRAISRCVKKSDRPFPHPRPSACISGSKVRSAGASKRAIPYGIASLARTFYIT